MSDTSLTQFIKEQFKQWPLLENNYCRLENNITKTINITKEESFIIQLNPDRIISSSANIEQKHINQRPCFLCKKNRPKEQISLSFFNSYELLINPYPVFPTHFTLADKIHKPQLISGRIFDMLRFANELPEHIIFYNGPKCGASAPDHFHFQAGNKSSFPLIRDFDRLDKKHLVTIEGSEIYSLDKRTRKAVVIKGSESARLISCIDDIINIFGKYIPDKPEPMLNILLGKFISDWLVFLFPRKKHRPDQYYRSGDEALLISPASAEFGGIIICPSQEDYDKINGDVLRNIFEQLTIDDDLWGNIKNDILCLVNQ